MSKVIPIDKNKTSTEKLNDSNRHLSNTTKDASEALSLFSEVAQEVKKRMGLWYRFKRWWELRVTRNYCENPIGGAEFRNLPCVCFSGEKIKNCCGKHEYVSNSWAEELVSKVRKAMKEAEKLEKEGTDPEL